MFGKKSSQKMSKKRFLYSHEYRDQKKGRKPRETIFPETQQIVRAKNVWKKIVAKNCEKTFFIFTRISWPKNDGKKRAKQFFQKHTNSASKKILGKNRRKILRKNVFYIHTNIVIKKWWKKRAKQFFQKRTNSASKKMMGKKSWQKIAK